MRGPAATRRSSAPRQAGGSADGRLRPWSRQTQTRRMGPAASAGEERRADQHVQSHVLDVQAARQSARQKTQRKQLVTHRSASQTRAVPSGQHLRCGANHSVIPLKVTRARKRESRSRVLYSRGSAPLEILTGQVAQLVEHRTENAGVAGSIPALATTVRSRSSTNA
jgi:hypothetical protein